MMKFNKAFNFKIIPLIVGISFLFTAAVPPSLLSNDSDSLRGPVGEKDLYSRMQKELTENNLANIIFLDEEIKNLISNSIEGNKFIFGKKENYTVKNIAKKMQNIARIIRYWNKNRRKGSFDKIADLIIQKTNQIVDHYYVDFAVENDRAEASGHNVVNNYSDSFFNNVIKMDENIAREISSQMVGYKTLINEDFENIISNITSFNELLNLVHSYVLENQYNIPDWAKSGKDNRLSLYLRNLLTDAAKKGKFSIVSDLDLVFILPIGNNKVYLQVRDLGHALSLNIEEQGKFIYVRYKIPKPFGRRHVENIKGFQYYDETFDYAVGEFKLEKNRRAGKEIIAFLNEIPTDDILAEANSTDYKSKTFWKDNNLAKTVLYNFNILRQILSSL